MYSIYCAVKEVWKQAGTGSVPVAVAAFMTHVAFGMFKDIEQTLEIFCGISSPQELLARHTQLLTANQSVTNHGEMHTDYMALSKELSEVCLVLLEKKTWADEADVESYATRRVGAGAKSAVRDFPRGVHAETRFVVARLFVDAMCVRSVGCKKSAIILRGSPLCADVGCFLLDEDRCNHFSFGFLMLHESMRGFREDARPGLKFSTCRITALQLAQEAIVDVERVLEDTTMPCRCERTLAFRLQGFVSELQTFKHLQMFDAFIQSPWVSGSHLLEIYDALFYYGLWLIRYHTYVGRTLHIYNMLCHLTDFKKIPLLERIAELFQDDLFPSGRPTRNFVASFDRFVGWRLKFASSSTHQNGCHGYQIPAHRTREDAGFGAHRELNNTKSQSQRVCFIHKIANRSFYIDRNTWKHIHEVSEGRTSRPSSASQNKKPASPQRAFSSRSEQDEVSDQLKALRKVVTSEAIGDLPIFRLNIFKFYLDCARTAANMHDAGHTKKGETGLHCNCDVQKILNGADNVVNRGRKWKGLGLQDLLEVAKKSIRDHLGSRPKEHYLWKAGY